MDDDDDVGFVVGGEGVIRLFRLDKLTGVFRLRFEHKFNGCSLGFFDKSSGLISSLINVGVKQQCAAGGGGGGGDVFI
jgi:hypothetical protein